MPGWTGLDWTNLSSPGIHRSAPTRKPRGQRWGCRHRHGCGRGLVCSEIKAKLAAPCRGLFWRLEGSVVCPIEALVARRKIVNRLLDGSRTSRNRHRKN